MSVYKVGGQELGGMLGKPLDGPRDPRTHSGSVWTDFIGLKLLEFADDEQDNGKMRCKPEKFLIRIRESFGRPRLL